MTRDACALPFQSERAFGLQSKSILSPHIADAVNAIGVSDLK
jgi:hypothetical protein